jgi:hypothetical protein
MKNCKYGQSTAQTSPRYHKRVLLMHKRAVRLLMLASNALTTQAGGSISPHEATGYPFRTHLEISHLAWQPNKEQVTES